MQGPIRPVEEIRVEIDTLDAELVRLLSRRAELAQEVGRSKGLTDQPFFTPERERQIFERLRALNPGPLTHDQIQAVFREIISAARAAERRLEVAFWGPQGTFTHVAARKTFGESTDMVAYDSISELFLAVEHKKVDYGVVPVENSVAGVVPETLDMFPQTNVKICSETFIPIAHHLLSRAGSLEDIQRVFAGPQPAAQCRRWLRANLPGAEIVEMLPTARAVQAAAEDPRTAAIANSLAAEIYGMPMLAEHIEDNAQNRTRFWVIGHNEPARTGRDKTSLMFNLRNRPGELYAGLGAFVAHEVNLLMIESRPGQRTGFEYLFFIDTEGHQSDPPLVKAVESLKRHALEMTILGSYPSG